MAAAVELVLDALDEDTGLEELDGGAELLLEEDGAGVEELLEDVLCSCEDEDDDGGGGGGDHDEDVVI